MRPEPKVQPIPLRELIAQLEGLLAMDDIERAKACKDEGKLGAIARASVAAAGDEALWRAKRKGLSYKDIMAALGYADDGPVARAVTRHNKRRSQGFVAIDRSDDDRASNPDM